MKRIFALLIVIASLFSFASCGISDDPTEVKNLLKDNGYKVHMFNSEDELEEVEWVLGEIDVSFRGIDSVIISATEDGEYPIAIAFCDSKDSAKAIEKDLEYLLQDDDMLEMIVEEMEDAGFEVSSASNYIIERSGSVVCIGHKNTVEIIK